MTLDLSNLIQKYGTSEPVPTDLDKRVVTYLVERGIPFFFLPFFRGIVLTRLTKGDVFILKR